MQSGVFNSNCLGMQQFCAMFAPASRPVSLYVGIVALLLGGCHREEIRSLSVPKETSETPNNSALVSAPPGHSRAIQWKTPAGWEEQPAGGMRVGSFSVTEDGQSADVSIIPLGGNSGSELANVNRWRGQVGLPPVEEGKLGEFSEKVTIGSTPGVLYDIAGTDAQSHQPTRILAAILPAEGTKWFFKMIGPDDVVAKEKPRFKALLQSVEFGAVPAGGRQAEPEPSLSAATEAMPDLSPPGHSADEKPSWDVPSGWQEQAAGSMRVASFLVTGEAGAKADISVIKLAGAAGGVLANVNRWRSQMGLPSVDEAGLEKLASHHDVQGVPITVVDMAGEGNSNKGNRLVAAIVPRSGATWFYKMLGNDPLVAQQKAAFIKFVQSARYPNAA